MCGGGDAVCKVILVISLSLGQAEQQIKLPNNPSLHNVFSNYLAQREGAIFFPPRINFFILFLQGFRYVYKWLDEPFSFETLPLRFF